MKKVLLQGIVYIVALLVFVSNAFSEEMESTKFYQSYASVLNKYVDGKGLVNYKDLKANRSELDSFIKKLSEVKNIDTYSRHEKIAFWINAYNALMLRIIVDNYPIKPSFTKSIIYPKNSARQIDGVFDEVFFNVAGKKVSLNTIEHEILRVQFVEPRIHMALVCGAVSCPYLLNEPFYSTRLNKQLDEQTIAFISRPEAFLINEKEETIQLSSIFDWFGDDFRKHTGAKLKKLYPSKEAGVLGFVSNYIDPDVQNFLIAQERDIEYSDYDWTLNEQ